MTPNENTDAGLFRKAQAGDVDARNAIVAANLGLLPVLLRPLKIPRPQADDARQVAALALVHAVETFDFDRCKFSTWARVCVRTKVSRWLLTERRNRGAHVPVHAHGELVEPAERPTSMDAPIGDGVHTLADTLAADCPSPEDQAAKLEQWRHAQRLLNDLRPTHRATIEATLDSDQATVARARGCSRQAVSVSYRQAIEALRRGAGRVL